MKTPIYMDHNATTAVYPEVKEAIKHALDLTGNASSVHTSGRAARKLIEDSRDSVAKMVNANSKDVVFTSGGTEANNMAIRSFAKSSAKIRILASAVEHSSILKASPNIEIVPVNSKGIIDLEALDIMLTESPWESGFGSTLVSVMLANNETGVIQPIPDVVSIAGRHGALVHCDAVQAAGKIPFDLKALGVNLLSLSAHKIGGTAGVGALIINDDLKKDVKLLPLLFGGGQERGKRAGTENLSGIAGFGHAVEYTLKNLPKYKKISILRDRIERELSSHSNVRVFGSGVSRLPNTSNLTMPGVSADRQIIAFDLAGFSLSAGSACSSGKVGPSHVLAAMGVANDEASTAIRISLGFPITSKNVEMFIKVWRDIFKRSNASTKDLEAA